jgi:hypothetical protein
MKRRAFLLTGATLVAAGAALRRFGPGRASSVSIEERARALGDRNGILIGYGPPSTFFVAPYTAKDAAIAHGTATAADPGVLGPALDGIEQSLRIYPPGFFKKLCGAIFLCGTLALDGAPAGGTYGPAWIILAAPRELGESGIFQTARLGVHHELSSLVWHRIPDLTAAWQRLLPASWTPSANNAAALRQANAAAPDPATGFLTAYGATDAENDFNVYAETVFTDPQRLSHLASSQPVVAKKLALLMAAFAILDDRMAAVFDGLGVGPFRAALPERLQPGNLVPPIPGR